MKQTQNKLKIKKKPSVVLKNNKGNITPPETSEDRPSVTTKQKPSVLKQLFYFISGSKHKDSGNALSDVEGTVGEMLTCLSQMHKVKLSIEDRAKTCEKVIDENLDLLNELRVLEGTIDSKITDVEALLDSVVSGLEYIKNKESPKEKTPTIAKGHLNDLSVKSEEILNELSKGS